MSNRRARDSEQMAKILLRVILFSELNVRNQCSSGLQLHVALTCSIPMIYNQSVLRKLTLPMQHLKMGGIPTLKICQQNFFSPARIP